MRREGKHSLGLLLGLALLTACGGGGGGGGAGNSTSSNQASAATPIVLSTFQTASVAIGQPDLISRTSAATASGLSGPTGNVTVNGNVLYVGDYAHSRLLGFNTIPTASGTAADFVLGQSSFTAVTGATTASAMNLPFTVQADQGKLLVADHFNSRILIFNTAPAALTTAPATVPAAADVAVGKPNLTTALSSCIQTELNLPWSFRVVNGKLIVADSLNSRVMIWNSIPTASNAPADLVLGQNSFTSCTRNDDDQNTIQDFNPSARTLNAPTDVWSDGTRLVVVDFANNRILIWKTFPTANFTPADIVLGQGSFTNAAPNDDDQNGAADATPSARTLSNPTFVDSDGTSLFVSDYNNSRVLIWNTFPTASFMPADVVLGQGNFTQAAPNDDDQNGTADAAPTARVLNLANGVRLIGNQLFVSDYGNNRVLVFQGQ